MPTRKGAAGFLRDLQPPFVDKHPGIQVYGKEPLLLQRNDYVHPEVVFDGPTNPTPPSLIELPHSLKDQERVYENIPGRDEIHVLHGPVLVVAQVEIAGYRGGNPGAKGVIRVEDIDDKITCHIIAF